MSLGSTGGESSGEKGHEEWIKRVLSGKIWGEESKRRGAVQSF